LHIRVLEVGAKVDQSIGIAPSKALECIQVGFWFGLVFLGDQEHAQVRGRAQKVRDRFYDSENSGFA